MKYRIFRVSDMGFLKDIGNMNYGSYLEAERVVKARKKDYPNTTYVILQAY